MNPMYQNEDVGTNEKLHKQTLAFTNQQISPRAKKELRQNVHA